MVGSESHSSSYESSFEDDASFCIEDENKDTDKNLDSLSADDNRSIHNELNEKNVVLEHHCNTETKLCGDANISNQSHEMNFVNLSNRCEQDANTCPNVTFSNNDSLKNERFVAWEIGQKDPSHKANTEERKHSIDSVKSQDQYDELDSSSCFKLSGSTDKLHIVTEREQDIRSLPNDIALSNSTSSIMEYSQETNNDTAKARKSSSLNQENKHIS